MVAVPRRRRAGEIFHGDVHAGTTRGALGARIISLPPSSIAVQCDRLSALHPMTAMGDSGSMSALAQFATKSIGLM
jgi:hypothetical protein